MVVLWSEVDHLHEQKHRSDSIQGTDYIANDYIVLSS